MVFLKWFTLIPVSSDYSFQIYIFFYGKQTSWTCDSPKVDVQAASREETLMSCCCFLRWGENRVFFKNLCSILDQDNIFVIKFSIQSAKKLRLLDFFSKWPSDPIWGEIVLWQKNNGQWKGKNLIWATIKVNIRRDGSNYKHCCFIYHFYYCTKYEPETILDCNKISTIRIPTGSNWWINNIIDYGIAPVIKSK